MNVMEDENGNIDKAKMNQSDQNRIEEKGKKRKKMRVDATIYELWH